MLSDHMTCTVSSVQQVAVEQSPPALTQQLHRFWDQKHEAGDSREQLVVVVSVQS